VASHPGVRPLKFAPLGPATLATFQGQAASRVFSWFVSPVFFPPTFPLLATVPMFQTSLQAVSRTTIGTQSLPCLPTFPRVGWNYPDRHRFLHPRIFRVSVCPPRCSSPRKLTCVTFSAGRTTITNQLVCFRTSLLGPTITSSPQDSLTRPAETVVPQR